MIDKQLNENEYAEYYLNYISLAPKLDIQKSLKKSFKIVYKEFKALSKKKWMYKYTEGKWTPKEMLLHLLDTERIMLYRALRISRNDQTELQGFEQDDYIIPSEANDRTIKSLLKEYKTLRKNTINFFENLSKEQLLHVGTASKCNVSVRALAYIISGHEIHHYNVLKEKYSS